MLMSGALDLLLPLPLYLLLLLGFLAVRAWRASAGAPGRKWRWMWTGAVVWAWGLSAPITSNELIRLLEPARQAAPAAFDRDDRTLIVVLASGDFRPRLDAPGWERLAGALHLWRQTGGTLLFSGGPGSSDENSLGGLMARVARESGVPPGSLRFVGGGRTTHEDIAQASPAVTQHLGPVWLVTSALHMPRAAATARRQGWTMRTHPVDYQQLELAFLPSCLPSNGGPQRLAEALHEVVGRLVYRLRGWSL
jgi:uncharacterized SAM-binding protein YcdF (DUF218 family)